MARNDSIAKMKIETTLDPGFGQSHSNAGPHHHVCQVRGPIMVLLCKSYVSKVFFFFQRLFQKIKVKNKFN